MFNRYEDGLGTWSPEPKEAYKEIEEKLAKDGYMVFKGSHLYWPGFRVKIKFNTC
jgi:hypothetical protein